MEAKQTPLIDLLTRVPENARCRVDELDGMGSVWIPVGRLCKDATDALRAAQFQRDELLTALQAVAEYWAGGDVPPELDAQMRSAIARATTED
jgi:hypothetical protein